MAGRVLAAALAGTMLAWVSAAGAEAAKGLRLVRVVGGLDAPVALAFAPGTPGRFYVAQQDGQIRIVERGKVLRRPFADLNGLVHASGERGLLGIAFDPRERRLQHVYVNYTRADTGATVVARFTVRDGRALNRTRRVVLWTRQPYANHNGGHLAFGPDGLLWVGLGDGGSAGDPEDRAQARGTLFGKLFTLDVRARAPKPRIVGYGLRNPWRYAFDRATGDLWIGDVGQNAVEEVSVLRRRAKRPVNFGWDAFEGSHRFEQTPLGPGTLISPIAEYGHDRGCSVTGGFVYRGKRIASLRGRYVFGDYCSGRIWSIAAAGGRLRREPVTLPGLVAFAETPAGELLLVSHAGTVHRLTTG